MLEGFRVSSVLSPPSLERSYKVAKERRASSEGGVDFCTCDEDVADMVSGHRAVRDRLTVALTLVFVAAVLPHACTTMSDELLLLVLRFFCCKVCGRKPFAYKVVKRR